jgi:hypothetical protein
VLGLFFGCRKITAISRLTNYFSQRRGDAKKKENYVGEL